MIERAIGKCSECGEDIVLKQPEKLEEYETLTDNDRGFVEHVGIEGLMFHVNCHKKMCDEGRWDWDFVETALSATRYEADLGKLLELDKAKGEWHHIPPIEGVSPLVVNYDKTTKKLVMPRGVEFKADKRVAKYIVVVE